MENGLKRDYQEEAKELVGYVYRYVKYHLQLTFMHFNFLMAREFKRSVHTSEACTLSKKTLFEVDSELERIDPRQEIRELLDHHYKNAKGKKEKKMGAKLAIQSIVKLLKQGKLKPLLPLLK